MKKYLWGALYGASVPTCVVAVCGAVGGYFCGFSLDCRGQPPGIQAAASSAAVAVILFSPLSFLGALLGTIIAKLWPLRRTCEGDLPDTGPEQGGQQGGES